MLFIASGAFHLSKPSDLIPELQGRLPIRVELDALGVDEFVRILTEPDASLTEQYAALMATEGGYTGILRPGVRASRRSPAKSTSAPKISARAACTPSWSACWRIVSFEATDRSGSHGRHRCRLRDRTSGRAVARDEDLSRYIL